MGSAEEKEKPSTTLPGTVEKIIKPILAGEAEKAQIDIEGAEELYREIRVDNTLKWRELHNDTAERFYIDGQGKHLPDTHLFVSATGPVPPIRLRGRTGRAIRIQSGGNQRVCNFQDVLTLFFKRPPSFCIHCQCAILCRSSNETSSRRATSQITRAAPKTV